jgi:N-acetylglucosaminyldiphosphoundecaprenol N-acetyl-beta-D-mannosaminyltransferase
VIDLGKQNVLGVLVDALDYDAAAARIIRAAEDGRPYAVTALAVHGVMTGVVDAEHRHRLNTFELVTPDGQPVRWALNLLSRAGLRDRVYGPVLTTEVLARAAVLGLPVFFYGSTDDVLHRLLVNLRQRWPDLVVAGTQASRFRPLTPQEKDDTVRLLRESGARIVFVGLGCPRQEVFCYEYRSQLDVPLVAVGAAFDYHAGTVREPPALVQRWGLQWLYRLLQEPRRLWRRYLVLNPLFLVRLAIQRAGLWRPDPAATRPPRSPLHYG